MNTSNPEIKIASSSPWLPAALSSVPEEIRYTFRISRAERKIFRKRKKLRPSRWCEANRVVTMSSRPGKWKNSNAPYLAGIMDASFYQSVREITTCAAPQTGKSEAVCNCIAVAADQYPGPALIVFPDEKTSDDNNTDRYQPMITSSPRLRTYMTGLRDDMSKKRIGLVHMPIYFGWAGSVASMANKPCRYAVNDETDKYRETASKTETSAVLLTKARLTTYEGQEKHWLISSPSIESGPIWKYYNAAQVRFDYWVKCPFCGSMQRMMFSGIKWARKEEPGPDGKIHSEDPDVIEQEKAAWYECEACGKHWNEYERNIAVQNGHWRDRETGLELYDYLHKNQPSKIAFHIPSWLSQFVPFWKVAVSFLRGQSDMIEFKDFCNKHLAEPWKLTVTSKSEDEILSARTDLPPQTVPEAAIALTCGIDVQKNGFWFCVRAWGPDMTSWLIHYGYLATWEDVEKFLFSSSYPVSGQGGNMMKIFRTCIDTGGGEKYESMTMTEETILWILKNRGRNGMSLWGTKGSSTDLPTMLKLGPEILSTHSGKKLPSGIRILSVDTKKAKDQYHFRLKLATDPETRMLPGGAFLHADTGTDYSAMIMAERKELDEKGREMWVNKHNRPNHLLDADLLAAACAEMEFPGGGLRVLAENLKRVQTSGSSRDEDKEPGFIKGNDTHQESRRSGWLNR